MTSKALRLSGTLALTAWWVYIGVRMIADARRDRGPTGLPNDLPNWHNLPGDLSFYLTLSAVELLVVLAILRPASYQRSWRRTLAAFALFVPWTFFWGMLMIHSGGIMVLHFSWLAGLCVALAILVAFSGIAALAARPASHSAPAI